MSLRLTLAAVLLAGSSAALAESPRAAERAPCPMQTHHIPAGKTVTSPIVSCAKESRAVAANDRAAPAPERAPVARD